MKAKFATPVMRLTERQYAVIVGHCYDGYPDEACGLLTGKLHGTEPDGRITVVSDHHAGKKLNRLLRPVAVPSLVGISV